MTSSEALKRSEKSQNLKVLHLEDSPWYYVESEEGKICYKVGYESETEYLCNCADFAKNYAKDPTFKCKHVMAVMNSITEGDSENVRYLEKWRPKLDEKFIMKIDDKDFVLYAGLLDVAHQKNLSSVDVELIQFPSDENKQTAICKATVKTVDGKTFTDIGDANPANCNYKIVKHIIRLSDSALPVQKQELSVIGTTSE
jgi:predicted nucleic acid-binding Zn finger protein